MSNISEYHSILEDGETVFRRIINRKNPAPKTFKRDKDNKLIVSASAFNDNNENPSVNRSKYCSAEITQNNYKENGVIEIEVNLIRSIFEGDQKLDVIPRPHSPYETPTQKAHSQIEQLPVANKNDFETVKELLSAHVNRNIKWAIEPTDFQ